MTDSTPSELLTQAADLIRDTAAAVGDEASRQWEQGSSRFSPDGFSHTWPQDAIWDGHGCCLTGGLADADARWIALLNPAVAPALEAWLRAAAKAAEDYEYWIVIPDWVRAAGDLAQALLGTPEETS